jgi:hypothetical protein
MKEEQLLICHAVQNKYTGFDIGKKYKTLPFSITEEFTYVINNKGLVMRFNSLELKDYFLNIKEWREQQLNKLLKKL